MKISDQLKELSLCIKLAFACERVKDAIYKKESAGFIIYEYERFLLMRNEFIRFEVGQLRKPLDEVRDKISDSMIAQIKQAIQITPFVKSRIEDYENKIGRSYNLT